MYLYLCAPKTKNRREKNYQNVKMYNTWHPLLLRFRREEDVERNFRVKKEKRKHANSGGLSEHMQCECNKDESEAKERNVVQVDENIVEWFCCCFVTIFPFPWRMRAIDCFHFQLVDYFWWVVIDVGSAFEKWRKYKLILMLICPIKYFANSSMSLQISKPLRSANKARNQLYVPYALLLFWYHATENDTIHKNANFVDIGSVFGVTCARTEKKTSTDFQRCTPNVRSQAPTATWSIREKTGWP